MKTRYIDWVIFGHTLWWASNRSCFYRGSALNHKLLCFLHYFGSASWQSLDNQWYEVIQHVSILTEWLKMLMMTRTHEKRLMTQLAKVKIPFRFAKRSDLLLLTLIRIITEWLTMPITKYKQEFWIARL